MSPTYFYTALITPLKEGKIDFSAFEEFFCFQQDQGVENFIVAGTTGEGILLRSDEYHELLKKALSLRKSTKIFACLSAVATEICVDQARLAESLGVDGLLIPTPTYVRAPKMGVYQHVEKIHDATQIPLIVYNNPARTGFEIDADLLRSINLFPRVIGLKDSVSDIKRIEGMSKLCKELKIGYFCGEDSVVRDFIKNEAEGWISVIGNLLPRESLELWKTKDLGSLSAQKVFDAIETLKVPFPNPVPIKYALHLLRRMNPEVRLPLIPLDEESRSQLEKGLIR